MSLIQNLIMKNNASGMKKRLFEDKSRMYRRQEFRKAFKKAAVQLISEKPKVTQRIAKTGLLGNRKIGKAGLQFAATTESILRSRDFWAGMAASALGSAAVGLIGNMATSGIKTLGRKKVSGTAVTLPKEVADSTVPDEYSQYIA